MRRSSIKRLFKAINMKSDRDILDVCLTIIDDLRAKGKDEFADELQRTLGKKKSNQSSDLVRSLSTFPVIGKSQETLFSVVDPELLDHKMVVSPSVEAKISRVESEFAARGRLSRHGLKPRRKLYFYGPAGCGKKLGAKRIAWTVGLKFVRVNVGALQIYSFPEFANSIRSVFDYCINHPSVLLFETCDFSGESLKGVSTLAKASEMLLHFSDEYNLPGLVVFTSNTKTKSIGDIAHSFDEHIFIDKPGEEERVGLLNVAFENLQVDRNIDWRQIVSSLKDFSAADIIKVAKNASKDAVMSNSGTLKELHLLRAINEYGRMDV